MKNSVLSLMRYTSVSRSYIFAACLSSALYKICEIIPDILVGVLIDVVVNQENSVVARFTSVVSSWQQIYLVAAAICIFWMSESIFQYLYVVMWKNIAQKVQQDIRRKTYKALEQVDHYDSTHVKSGAMLAVIQDDLRHVEQFISIGLPEAIEFLVNMCIIGALFVYVAPHLALLSVIPLGAIGVLVYYFHHELKSLYDTIHHISSAFSCYIVHRLQAAFLSKRKKVIDQGAVEFAAQDYKQQQVYATMYHMQASYMPCMRAAVTVGISFLLMTGGLSVLKGTTPAMWYAVLVFLIQKFLWPFLLVAHVTDLYEHACVCSSRMLVVLSKK